MKFKCKPYSEKEIEKLLSTTMSDKVKKVRVSKMINTKTLLNYYGLIVTLNTDEEMGLCEGNRAVIFDEEKTAKRVCREIRKQLGCVMA